jgi:hypothetical protein
VPEQARVMLNCHSEVEDSRENTILANSEKTLLSARNGVTLPFLVHTGLTWCQIGSFAELGPNFA